MTDYTKEVIGCLEKYYQNINSVYYPMEHRLTEEQVNNLLSVIDGYFEEELISHINYWDSLLIYHPPNMSRLSSEGKRCLAEELYDLKIKYNKLVEEE